MVATGARHIFDPANFGYTTWVTVGGKRDRSTLALASGGVATHAPTIPGVVSATVIETEDPLMMGRVKLMFPWLSPDYVSDYCRVMQIGASALGTGFQWFPNPGDEVLVAFDRGCFENPYVIGGVYNGIDKAIPTPEWAPLLNERSFISGLGHHIRFGDNEALATGVTIGTTPFVAPPQMIKLDAQQMKITINNLSGEIEITGMGPVSISSQATMTITAPAITIGDETCTSVTIGGKAVTMGSQAESITVGGGASIVNVSGSMINLGGM